MTNARDVPLWRPDPQTAARSQIAAFQRIVEQQTGQRFASYADFHRWSVDARPAFWKGVWSTCDIVASRQPTTILTDDRFLHARWFTGARLNFAENLLLRRDDHPALISYLETGERRELSYAQLADATARLAAWMRACGISPGDRVAAWLPNIPETIIAMLATASIGAIFSSCSPDFGASGALDRFGQIEPALLIACDGYYYNGKRIDIRDKVNAVAREVASIRNTVWMPVLGELRAGDTSLADLLRGNGPAPEHRFEQLPFDHPLYIVYSSGTTGKPKCIVHGAGGSLLQHLKEQRLHLDLSADDTLFFFTTAGWMMWNWLASALAIGGTLILYDGSPFHPSPAALFDLAVRERVTVFGISAKYLQSVENHGVKPRQTHDLSRVRMLISTGSTLPPEGFRYVYRDISESVHLVSMSGGTDLLSCFILGNPTLPVYAGELQCAGLGMAVAIYDEAGRPVRNTRGELVCTHPFPSAPIGFWRDEDNARYRAAYFERFDGVWAHGDFAQTTPNDGFIIHGRSDAVLNPGGVRIGTAEIYRQVETFPDVLEAVCIGQEWENDTRVILFLVLREGARLTAELEQAIRGRIREHASPRHVPAVILTVPDIPRTMSGKIAEIAVRESVHGRPVKNTSALANPEALQYFVGRL
ncbi:MAG: acetoacetate--CoA ligase [Pseudomonadales bacterium]|nr:acetoacetate--CoA ligase [Pseudomonadales bacterium]